MGFFDKVKNSLTGGGAKVKMTWVEDPFPEEDTVIKGNFEVSAEKECIITGYTARFYAESEDEGDIDLGEEEDDGSDEVIGREFQYPVTLQAGDKIEDGFVMIMDKSVKKQLKKYDLKRKDCEFYVEVDVNVKGVLNTPDAKKKVNVVAGGSD